MNWCQWVSQPPKASHASGVWERLIRSTRTALKAMLGENLVEEDVLATVLTEVEATLKSRPLCVVSDNPPLRPSTISTKPPFVAENSTHLAAWNLCERRYAVDKEMETDADIG